MPELNQPRRLPVRRFSVLEGDNMRCDPYFTKKRQLSLQLPFLGEVGLE